MEHYSATKSNYWSRRGSQMHYPKLREGLLVAQMVKNLPAVWETQFDPWVGKIPWTTHSSILAWKIPWAEEPGGLQSMGSQKSQTWLRDFFHFQVRENRLQKQCTVRIPFIWYSDKGESMGIGSRSVVAGSWRSEERLSIKRREGVWRDAATVLYLFFFF